DPVFDDFARQSQANFFLKDNSFAGLTTMTGARFEAVSVTSDYSIGNLDFSVTADATTDPDGLNLFLPPAIGSGQLLRVSKSDSSAQLVVVKPFGSDKIAGASSVTFIDQFGGAVLQDIAPGVWDDIGSIIVPMVTSPVSWSYRPDVTSDLLLAAVPTAGYQL